jgi:hypothetical protein
LRFSVSFKKRHFPLQFTLFFYFLNKSFFAALRFSVSFKRVTFLFKFFIFYFEP